MSKIKDLTESWNNHTFEEVENVIKDNITKVKDKLDGIADYNAENNSVEYHGDSFFKEGINVDRITAITHPDGINQDFTTFEKGLSAGGNDIVGVNEIDTESISTNSGKPVKIPSGVDFDDSSIINLDELNAQSVNVYNINRHSSKQDQEFIDVDSSVKIHDGDDIQATALEVFGNVKIYGDSIDVKGNFKLNGKSIITNQNDTTIAEINKLKSGNQVIDVPQNLTSDETLVISSDLNNLFDDVYFNNDKKTIEFKHGNTILQTVDATDFIKDGMVSNVEIVDTNLVITFNTDSGKDTITIPISKIFDSDKYYTKEDSDSRFASKNGDFNEDFDAKRIDCDNLNVNEGLTSNLVDTDVLEVGGSATFNEDVTISKKIRKGTYFYELPSASGTFALSSTVISGTNLRTNTGLFPIVTGVATEYMAGTYTYSFSFPNELVPGNYISDMPKAILLFNGNSYIPSGKYVTFTLKGYTCNVSFLAANGNISTTTPSPIRQNFPLLLVKETPSSGNYICLNFFYTPPTLPSIISQSEITTGTSTTGRTISSKLLSNNFYKKDNRVEISDGGIQLKDGGIIQMSPTSKIAFRNEGDDDTKYFGILGGDTIGTDGGLGCNILYNQQGIIFQPSEDYMTVLMVQDNALHVLTPKSEGLPNILTFPNTSGTLAVASDVNNLSAKVDALTSSIENLGGSSDDSLSPLVITCVEDVDSTFITKIGGVKGTPIIGEDIIKAYNQGRLVVYRFLGFQALNIEIVEDETIYVRAKNYRDEELLYYQNKEESILQIDFLSLDTL